ncbi:efflux RND transporter permease subunit [Roseomonas sp. NAR14]|uniref:Efflux RND transporter permease subunit n=1 Tax=Roseomonas acroporae TaxID=2937791 RepID=A0A9X1Y523_9PROT|nr:efflux RND transporter permease subunit [Roseomonas acroporae]MCK8783588.1 efflux RND transporter permease subunit [Roseomonas acroporae]
MRSISDPFIRRPIGTALLALGLALAGLVALIDLPVAPLPRVDFPTIMVRASQPGADPATMASSVAAPLERRLGEIAGVTEMTSTSSLGSTNIVVQFDLSRNIDSAARDVQAAINAAQADLPSGLPSPPTFFKANPADAPVLILAVTSATLTPGAVYDAVDSLVIPRIAQVEGVAQVSASGAEQPAIRIAVDPAAATAANVSLEAIRQAIAGANVTQAVGAVEGRDQTAHVVVNDRIDQPEQFARIVIRADNGSIIRISNVAHVTLGTRDRNQAGWYNDRPAVNLMIFKQPDANVIEVVNGIQALLPQLARWLPAGIEVFTIRDRSETIRASVAEVEHTLMITVALVVMVVAVFLRRFAAIAAAGIAVPLSLLGTLAVMWLAGFSLNNLSLMALTISVGFVVDDAIVVIENMARLNERGMGPLEAALVGARQIGFTVLSMTVSLIAVFIPLLFMGGIVGRLFHEFSVTLAFAVGLSGVVSLTVTPMMAAHLARPPRPPGRLARGFERLMDGMTEGYMRSLALVLRFRRSMLLFTLGLVGLTVWLYVIVPKGFFPEQDTGLIAGTTVAANDTSFQTMLAIQQRVSEIILADPAVASVGASVGSGGGFNAGSQGRIFVSLKPPAERGGVTSAQVIDRLRRPLGNLPGAQTFLRAMQDLNIGGRAGNAQYQLVLLDPDLEELQDWTERLVQKLRTVPALADVNSDQQRAGLVAKVVIDRELAGRLGVSVTGLDAALNNAFAQRQVSTIYRTRNQYRVILEVDPRLQQDPAQLDRIYVPASTGGQVPLSALVRIERTFAPLTVTHQGQYPAATITFNLPAGGSLGTVEPLIRQAAAEIHVPPSVRIEFAGSARAFQNFQGNMPLLILAAFLAIYIVLGVLYESLIHPLTIISTLPTAGIGALLALLATGTELSVIALIGVILLMGIVKKNAIMLVDFALEHERSEGVGGTVAILEACRERFRPILMTTLAALLGAVPLALAYGAGGELRRPLGITIIGGLALSQLLTLYTTPVVYLAFDRLSTRTRRRRAARGALPAE